MNTVPSHISFYMKKWQEFRAHNIIFGMRSISCTVMAWFAVYKPQWRRVSVIGSSLSVLAAIYAADLATARFRENDKESTTATMPYVSRFAPLRLQLSNMDLLIYYFI